jgi:multidrug resistance protein, MATE family
VFVGKLYGETGKDKEVAKPCWSMIWLSVMSAAIFTPLGLFASKPLFESSCYPDLCERFFKSLIYFGPVFGINMALVSFWVGRGKTKFVTLVTIAVNILNIILDPLLIFGLYGFPVFGLEGAGYSTGISQVVEMVILFIAYLRHTNRISFGTGQWKLDKKSFFDCINLGFPLMVTISVQATAWSFIARMMSTRGEDTLLIWGVIHTAFMLFSFIGDAVGRAVTAISANLIGAGRQGDISKIVRSGIIFHLLVFSVLFSLFLLFPHGSISLFLENYDALPLEMKYIMFSAMCWNVMITFAEALLYVWAGALTSLGDTKFLGVTGSVLIWILGVIPAAYATSNGWSGDLIIAATIWYYIGATIAYYMRYTQKIARSYHKAQDNFLSTT